MGLSFVYTVDWVELFYDSLLYVALVLSQRLDILPRHLFDYDPYTGCQIIE
jgi:hypothetical protein